MRSKTKIFWLLILQHLRNICLDLIFLFRHCCQAIGCKPQPTNVFKKALDKLTNVYQSRTSSGMQLHGTLTALS